MSSGIEGLGPAMARAAGAGDVIIELRCCRCLAFLGIIRWSKGRKVDELRLMFEGGDPSRGDPPDVGGLGGHAERCKANHEDPGDPPAPADA